MPFVRVKRRFKWAEDQIHNVQYEPGDEVEVSLNCAAIAEREGWAKIIEASKTRQDEDDAQDTPSDSDPGDDSVQDEDSHGDDGGDSEEESDEPEVEVSATPKALELAEELGVDLANVVGTGTNGTVTVADVRKAVLVE